MPRTRDGGMSSLRHISLTMEKSSVFAAGEPRKASMGMPSQPGALPLRNTRRQVSSSWEVTSSESLSSTMVSGAYAAPGTSAHSNFLPRKCCQASSSCRASVSGSPLAALVGMTYPPRFHRPASAFVSRATSHVFPTRFAASMSLTRSAM